MGHGNLQTTDKLHGTAEELLATHIGRTEATPNFLVANIKLRVSKRLAMPRFDGR